MSGENPRGISVPVLEPLFPLSPVRDPGPLSGFSEVGSLTQWLIVTPAPSSNPSPHQGMGLLESHLDTTSKHTALHAVRRMTFDPPGKDE